MLKRSQVQIQVEPSSSNVTGLFADSGRVSLGTNRYQKLPSGLIIQWGVITVGLDTSATLTFPVAFTAACFSVVGNGDWVCRNRR